MEQRELDARHKDNRLEFENKIEVFSVRKYMEFSSLTGSCASSGDRAVSGEGPRQLTFWDCGVECPRKHGWLSVVCCHVQVSATS